MRISGGGRAHVDNNNAVCNSVLSTGGGECKLSTATISRFFKRPGVQITQIKPDNNFIPWFQRAASDTDEWPGVLECSKRGTINSNTRWRWILTSYQTAANALVGSSGDTGDYTGANHHYPTPYGNQQLFFKGSSTGLRTNTGKRALNLDCNSYDCRLEFFMLQ